MSRRGADAQSLERLEQLFSRSANTLQRAETDLSRLIQSCDWSGHDGANFRELWNGELKQRFGRSAALLQQQAQHLSRQRHQQREASAAEGGSLARSGASAAVPGTPFLSALWSTAILTGSALTLGKLVHEVNTKGIDWVLKRHGGSLPPGLVDRLGDVAKWSKKAKGVGPFLDIAGKAFLPVDAIVGYQTSSADTWLARGASSAISTAVTRNPAFGAVDVVSGGMIKGALDFYPVTVEGVVQSISHGDLSHLVDDWDDLADAGRSGKYGWLMGEMCTSAYEMGGTMYDTYAFAERTLDGAPEMVADAGGWLADTGGDAIDKAKGLFR